MLSVCIFTSQLLIKCPIIDAGATHKSCAVRRTTVEMFLHFPLTVYLIRVVGLLESIPSVAGPGVCRWGCSTVAKAETALLRPPHLHFEFIWTISFFFFASSWVTDHFPYTKYNKIYIQDLHALWPLSMSELYWSNKLQCFIINIGHFSFWSSQFHECSAAAAPRVSWSSSIDCLDNPKNMLLQLASLSSLLRMMAQGNFRCTYSIF